MNDVHKSSQKHDWETPPEIFEPLHEAFGFTVDAAATRDNRRVPRHFDDGLAVSWRGERVWCNPPSGREQIKFIEYAALREADLSALLIPARPDTRVWRDYVFPRAEVWFLTGRIRFRGAPHAAPFPSALVFFRPGDVEFRARGGTLTELLRSSRPGGKADE